MQRYVVAPLLAKKLQTQSPSFRQSVVLALGALYHHSVDCVPQLKAVLCGGAESSTLCGVHTGAAAPKHADLRWLAAAAIASTGRSGKQVLARLAARHGLPSVRRACVAAVATPVPAGGVAQVVCLPTVSPQLGGRPTKPTPSTPGQGHSITAAAASAAPGVVPVSFADPPFDSSTRSAARRANMALHGHRREVRDSQGAPIWFSKTVEVRSPCHVLVQRGECPNTRACID